MDRRHPPAPPGVPLTDARLFEVDDLGLAVQLSARFGYPPFTLLNTRSGHWHARYQGWVGPLGLRSAEGRNPDAGAFNTGSNTEVGAAIAGQNGYNGVSIFDPVLCELAVRWWSAPGHRVLDPYAGGSVRGIVSAVLGREYVGIDLSPTQVEANYRQLATISPQLAPVPPRWVVGDSQAVLPQLADILGTPAHYDLLLTCPPYFDLERYSTDPADLSNMPWERFVEAYWNVWQLAADQLYPNRFAVVVVGDVRDRAGCFRNLVGVTIEALEGAGLRFYNDAILMNAVGSARMRAPKQFAASRKLATVHQRVLTFVKGDPKLATAACGDVDMTSLVTRGEDGLE